MDDKPLESGDRKGVLAEEPKGPRSASDRTNGPDGQVHSPRQASQDGHLQPPENAAQAGPIVVPSPLDARHQYVLFPVLALTP